MKIFKEKVKPKEYKCNDIVYLNSNLLRENKISPFDYVEITCKNDKSFILKVLETETEFCYLHNDIYQEITGEEDIFINKIEENPLNEVQFVPLKEDNLKFISKHFGKSIFGSTSPPFFEKSIKRKLLGCKVTKNSIIPIQFLGEKYFIQFKCENQGKIEEDTKILFQFKEEYKKDKFKLVGLEKQKKELKTLLDKVFIKKQELPLKSSLLYGPTGTGKTSFAKQIASEYEELGVNIHYLEDSREMRRFLSIDDNSSSIVIVDNIESQDQNLIHQLLDKIVENETFLIGISLDHVELRFDKIIHFPIPNKEERSEILKLYLLDSKWNEEIVSFTSGFVGKDLARLCDLIKGLKKEKLEWNDIENSLLLIRPSNLIDFGVKVDPVPWENIGGYEKVKKDLIQTLFWPQTESFKKLNLPSSSGVLLYGPSGCGKTLFCKGLASFGKMNYIQVRAPELFSKYFGETERSIRNVFSRARELEPCVLVIDEIDSIGTSRTISDTDSGVSNRAITQILTEMDGIEEKKQIFVIGCTTDKDSLDTALIRPGRLDRHIYIGKPNENDRLEILKVLSRKVEVLKSLNLEDLAKKSEGYTCSKIVEMVNKFALQKLKEEIENNEKLIQKMDNLTLK